MNRIGFKRTMQLAVLVAVTMPIFAPAGWCQVASGLSSTVVRNENLTVQASTTTRLPAGPSLGGSNELLPPPNISGALDLDGLINTGKGALHESIELGGGTPGFPGDPGFEYPDTPANRLIAAKELAQAQEEAGYALNSPTPEEAAADLAAREKAFNELIMESYQKQAVEALGITYERGLELDLEYEQMSAANALEESDPFNPSPEEEAAASLADPGPRPIAEEGAEHSGGHDGPRTAEEESAAAVGGEPNGGTTGSSGGSGSGSGSIFQDPTKGGPSVGIEQSVEISDELKNSTFEGFENGVSPFAKANLEEGTVVAVPRALSSATGGTNAGASSINAIEEENVSELGRLPLSSSAGKAPSTNLNVLSELEAEESINASLSKVRVNTAVLESPVEAPIQVLRR